MAIKIRGAAAVVAIMTCSLGMGAPVRGAEADTDPQVAADQAAKARADAETERLKAEKGKIDAQADLERARIAALGLPSFEGKTTLEKGAGEVEAMQLAVGALQEGAKTISAAVTADSGTGGKPLLVVGATDPLDFAAVGSIRFEMVQIGKELDQALAKPPGKFGIAPAAVIAGVSALAGLIRTEATVTPAALPEISDPLLVTAVAANLKSKAIIPAAAIASFEDDGSALLTSFNALVAKNEQAHQLRQTLAGEKSASAKARVATLDAAMARFKAFYTRVTTADAAGLLPIMAAARLERVSNAGGKVLRVHVDKAGGSLTSVKNIGTFFGVDPIRITGGLVLSYMVTDPADGSVFAAGVINCRTTRGTLTEVQRGAWGTRTSDGQAKPSCATLQ